MTKDRPSNAGRPPRCCACGEKTHDGVRNEENKTICPPCEKLCAWCGNDAGGDLRDEGGARICEGCKALPGPTQAQWAKARAKRSRASA